MLITNGVVMTMEGNTIENGYVHIGSNGLIDGIGDMSQAPVDEEIIDANGGYILPGFVDAHCHLGMVGDSTLDEDDNEMSDPCTPQLRAIDAINPLDRYFSEARAGGITSVITGPGSANAICGQLAAVKTAGNWLDDMIIKAPVAMKMALGENPKNSYGERHETPMTRMAIAAVIRENLAKAVEYRDKRNAAKEDPDLDMPDYDAALEALVPVVDGQLPVHFHAHRADDIATAVRIAKEYNLDYVIVHGTDGHIVAKALAKAGAKVITGPCLTDRSKPELAYQSMRSPSILLENGVPVAICTDHPETPIQFLPLCAAMAAKYGMSEEEALKCVTIRAAEITGIADRVGSLKIGKDGDVVVWSGNPFEFRSKVTDVVVNGIKVEI